MKQGWQIKRLSEICIKCNNIKWDVVDEDATFQYIDLTSVDRDDLCIHNPQIINKDNAPSRAKQIISTGDILFATTRPTLRRVSLIGEKYNNAICSTGFCVLRPNKEVLPKYVFYALQEDGFYKYIEPLQTGASYPAVTDGVVKSFPIPVPTLSEQQRIVSLLDAQIAKIDAIKVNAERNLQNAKDLFLAALKKELEPKEGWKWSYLPSISENLDSKRIPITQKDRMAGVYPYYGASGIVDYVSEYLFDDDLLLISEDGANLLARSTPIAFSVSGKIWVNNHAHILKFKDMATQKIVEYYFASILIDEYITGAAQPKLTQANMNKIAIPIPPTISDQQTIVALLDTLNEKCKPLQANYEKAIALCDDLKQALLRNAFNGEL